MSNTFIYPSIFPTPLFLFRVVKSGDYPSMDEVKVRETSLTGHQSITVSIIQLCRGENSRKSVMSIPCWISSRISPLQICLIQTFSVKLLTVNKLPAPADHEKGKLLQHEIMRKKSRGQSSHQHRPLIWYDRDNSPVLTIASSREGIYPDTHTHIYTHTDSHRADSFLLMYVVCMCA